MVTHYIEVVRFIDEAYMCENNGSAIDNLSNMK
jgi:hypothetical protein